MPEPYLALQVLMMPKDANGLPADDSSQLMIFGGVLLSYLDQAGAIGARHEVARLGGKVPMVVTVAMNRVEFKKPVLVGDVVRFLTRVLHIGRTSITMQINVEVDRGTKVLQVTEAEVVYVGIDATGPERKPVALLE